MRWVGGRERERERSRAGLRWPSGSGIKLWGLERVLFAVCFLGREGGVSGFMMDGSLG